jgi:hypothetical protein
MNAENVQVHQIPVLQMKLMDAHVPMVQTDLVVDQNRTTVVLQTGDQDQEIKKPYYYKSSLLSSKELFCFLSN